jgi:ketosteroid isomerase-like protein
MMMGSIAVFPDLTMTLVRLIEAGDTVVTEELMRGTTAAGKQVEVPMAHITRVLDDLIVERVAYHDTAAITQALSA